MRQLDIHLATVDDQGRLPLRKPATDLAWPCRSPVGLTVDDGILRLSDTRGAFIEAEGVTVDLDQRWRLQVPYGIRATTGLHPGVRVIALTTVDRGLVVLPAYRLLPNAETDGIS